MSIDNISTDTEKDNALTSISDALPTIQDPVCLDEKSIIESIIEAPAKDELQLQLYLFNMTQSKKNAMRIVKLNNLLDKIEDQAIERFKKRPDQISNKELLDYMNVISGQIDRAHRQIDSISNTPAVAVTNQKTDVTINVGNDLDRDSKERVMDAISALLKQVKAIPESEQADNANYIEADFEDKTSEESANDTNIEE